jgi:hypothetical protein
MIATSKHNSKTYPTADSVSTIPSTDAATWYPARNRGAYIPTKIPQQYKRKLDNSKSVQIPILPELHQYNNRRHDNTDREISARRYTKEE